MAWGEQGQKITWTPNVVSDDKKQHGGWYDNPSTGYNQRWYSGGATSENGNSSSSGFSIPQPDMEAINREYQPIYENYARDEQFLKESQASEQEMLNDNFTLADTRLDRNKTERELHNKEQETTLNNQYRSAYEEVVRAQNALTQQGNVRFGGTSSAGRAMGEIAQSEFFRQSGKIQNTHLENIGRIQSDWRKYLSWHADEEQRLVQEKRHETTKLQNTYKQMYVQIANNRNITKSEQARAQRNAQETYQARKADLENSIKLRQMAMDEYAQKLRMELDAQIELAGKTAYSVSDNTFASDTQSDVDGVSYVPSENGSLMNMNTSYVNPFARARYSDDEFEDNPYFA